MFLREFFMECYIGGVDRESGLRMVVALHRRGLGTIWDRLGEEVQDFGQVEKITKEYLEDLRCLAILRSQYPSMKIAISIKLSQFGLKKDEVLTISYIRKIFWVAVKNNIPVEIDVEGKETVEDMARVIKDLADGLENYRFRVAIAMNQDFAEMLFGLCHSLGLGVRLVSGAYPGDYSGRRTIFRRFADFMRRAKDYKVDVALGTHRTDIIKEAIKIFGDDRGFLAQMLFGVRMFFQERLARERIDVRTYMPVGSRENSNKYLARRRQEGIRLNVFFLFVLNIFGSWLWRRKYASFSD